MIMVYICITTFLDSTTSFVYNYKPANFKKDFISALTALVTAQDDPQRLKELTVGAMSILNDYQNELSKVLRQVKLNIYFIFTDRFSPRFVMLQVMQTCSGVTDDGVGMFLECYWYGKKYECSDLFKLRPTDSGFCCSFNTLAMEEQL